jgi:copper chaperone CopZ
MPTPAIRSPRLAQLVCSLLFLLPACGSQTDPRVSSTVPVVYRYSVKGMHCQGCVDAITDKVTHIDGVVDCQVNLQEQSATVAVRSAAVEPQVRSGMERLGYTVAPSEAPAAAPHAPDAASTPPAGTAAPHSNS